MMLRQIKYFVSVVDCKSFTDAAEACFISQSAISQQISALEKDLGVQLLRRESRRFYLTPAGEYFYRRGRELLREADTLRQETARIGEDEELHLSIGYPESYAGRELRRAIVTFTDTYPEVMVSVSDGTHEQLYDRLRSGQVDLVMNDQRRAFSDDYENLQLALCDSYAELSVRNELSRRERLEVEELSKIPCILIASADKQAEERDYYEKILGFGSNILFADNLVTARLMVISNRGFIPLDGSGTMASSDDAICRVPIYRNGQPLQRNYCAFWQKARANYYIEEFADILKKYFGE